MGAEQARRARAHRAAALLDVQERRTSVATALYDTPGPLYGVDAYVLVLHCPGIGRTKARRVFEETGIWPHTRLCHLTTDQRRALKEVLTREGRP
jgi:hypothetical protein